MSLGIGVECSRLIEYCRFEGEKNEAVLLMIAQQLRQNAKCVLLHDQTYCLHIQDYYSYLLRLGESTVNILQTAFSNRIVCCKPHHTVALFIHQVSSKFMVNTKKFSTHRLRDESRISVRVLQSFAEVSKVSVRITPLILRNGDRKKKMLLTFVTNSQ